MEYVETEAAQTSNATLQGVVADTSGAVLPGVTVKLESPTTGLSCDLITNTAGVYVFNFLPAGSYVIVAELSGFKTVHHDQIRLEIGQNLIKIVSTICTLVTVLPTTRTITRARSRWSGVAPMRPMVSRSPRALGPSLPQGVMIAMNSAPRNFLVYRWQDVITALPASPQRERSPQAAAPAD